EEIYMDKLKGSFLARMAGCTLGAIVEAWPISKMEEWSKECNQPFPPTDYWTDIPDPDTVRYGVSKRKEYLRYQMDGVPVDDDITYTILGLLIAEQYGTDFTVENVGQAWVKYLPVAYTAEDIALKNLKKGIPADQCGEKDNPYQLWIGAYIRSDPWGYMAPGWPEKAAQMAWTDAMLSHRRTGIYGAMYFAAVISAAFTTDDLEEALRIGLTEIPENCTLAKEIAWAIQEGKNVHDYRQAREIVDNRYQGMSGVHTVNNAVLTIFGLMIGRDDLTKVLSQTVAMGLDNDCNGATAGSIAGALSGFEKLPEHWYAGFNDKVHTYMNDCREFKISDLLNRFSKQASFIWRL
ncbi:MAG TPA: ADP-ribosylglycohydrolase family protein, partial [Clostridiales bacterium]|nr:ADP-ribosylglycohydrolase family protein [Clostridiales bacterium]